MATVTCSSCSHDADVQTASDVWKCNCGAGVGPDDCDCTALNENPGTEDNSVDEDDREIAELEARLLSLRGSATPKGDSNV